MDLINQDFLISYHALICRSCLPFRWTSYCFCHFKSDIKILHDHFSFQFSFSNDDSNIVVLLPRMLLRKAVRSAFPVGPSGSTSP